MRTVLLVEDEPAILTLLVDLLTDEGYATVSATNGQQALDLLTSRPVDVVVTDVMMPILGGLDLLGAVRAQPALDHVDVIVISAGTAPDVRALGGFAFLSKPFDLGKFLATVAETHGGDE